MGRHVAPNRPPSAEQRTVRRSEPTRRCQSQQGLRRAGEPISRSGSHLKPTTQRGSREAPKDRLADPIEIAGGIDPPRPSLTGKVGNLAGQVARAYADQLTTPSQGRNQPRSFCVHAPVWSATALACKRVSTNRCCSLPQRQHAHCTHTRAEQHVHKPHTSVITWWGEI